jgi:alpha-beta hydrolase superfamily lysophospholipase
MLRADDGVEIAVYRWLPEGRTVRGIVQIAHGMAEHGARYARFAARLNRDGWAVYASDHRGHGNTAAHGNSLGYFADEDGWARVVGDLRTVAAHARGEHPRVPLVLFAHSMGSYVAQSLVLAYPRVLDGLILSGTSIGGGALVRAGVLVAKLERLRQGKHGTSALLARMSFGKFNDGFEGRTAFDWLSRDQREVDKYVADPKCGFPCANQLWVDLLGGVAELGRADWSRLPRDLPVLVFAGELDPVGDRGKGVRKLVAAMRAAHLSVTDRLYPQGRHEMLNETNRDDVENDVATWLAEHFATPS